MRFLTYLAAGLVGCFTATATVLPHDYEFSDIEARKPKGLPSSFEWSSTGPLIAPKNDGRNISGIKDPSIIYYKGSYHVFASTAQESGYSMVYLTFKDFSEAQSATFYYLDQTPIGTGYRAAPQVFYFKPQKLWYLVYQNGNAAYSTNTDVSNPAGWTAPKTFYPSQPQIIADNIGSGYWVDMWSICNTEKCFLFSSDDNGHLYRSETTLADYPNGMNNTVIAKSDDDGNIYSLYEASNVYHLTSGGYLLIVEAISQAGDRYFRSWTSDVIDGNWTALAATEANPFASKANVVFPGGAWTNSISHGEMIRTRVDQTLTISPCNLRYLYQGLNPADQNVTYNALPWRLALLTQTNSPC